MGWRQDQRGTTLVELLVVIVLLAIIGAATTGVVVAVTRNEGFQRNVREVIDDGRVSLQAIRKELRSARRVLADSGPDRLHFWVDENQDAIRQANELICYVVRPLGTGRWEIVRWEGATVGCDTPPAGASVRTLARTLVDPNPFVAYRPAPSSNVDDPPTREVDIVLELEVAAGRTHSVTVDGTVRLRNVA